MEKLTRRRYTLEYKQEAVWLGDLRPKDGGGCASLAALCGLSPLQASSGKTVRHRLNRGGDRSANNALWTIALVRMRSDPRTRAYVHRRTKEGMTKKQIHRCIKRYLVREVYLLILADLAASSKAS
jgi:hypothetical protein